MSSALRSTADAKAKPTRLKKRADYLRVAATKRRAVAKGLVLQAGPRPVEAGHQVGGSIRLGFTASKKVGNAVARNRARRRLKEAAASVMPGLADPSLDYVLIARSETVTRPYADLLTDLQYALRKLRR